jgi:hypothetical protein
MYNKARDHVTVSAVARSLRSYPAAIVSLCERGGVPIVSLNGVRFLADDQVDRVRELLAAWRDRPRLDIARIRRRGNRRRVDPDELLYLSNRIMRYFSESPEAIALTRCHAATSAKSPEIISGYETFDDD